MPFLRNPLFVGREDELRALARALLASDTAIAAIAATGMGGIGKSNLASEFVHRYGQFFRGGVFWLSFADPAGVPAEIAACGGAGALNLPSFDALAFDDQVARVRQEWQRPAARLLVFDNCEDEALLADWRPTSGGARVLVTSRRTDWDPALGVDTLRLAVLPREQSIALLRRFRPDRADDAADLDAIAAELGDLPLALHLAGSFLKRYRTDVTPAAYLDQLRAVSPLDHESLQGLELDYSPTRHVLDVGRTFTLSFDKLRPDNAVDVVALALLTRAACFAPGAPIPRDLLLATIDLPDHATRRRANRALTRLVDLGLLDEEQDGALTIHRLVAVFVRRQVANTDALGAIERAITNRSYDLLSKGLPASFVVVQVHLRHLVEPARERADGRAANICTAMGRYLQLIGDYAAALPYARRALAIREQTLGPNHSDTATGLNDLALLLYLQGDYAAARPLFERALAIREHTLGPSHPDTATNLNNLAQLLYLQGDYAAARPLFERALAIYEQTRGPSHPDAAANLNNLAVLLMAQGDDAAARPLLERALAIYEQTLGPTHPNTAASLSTLATLLYTQRDYAAAHPLYERALDIREHTLGPSHPDTAKSLNNLALLLKDQGDYAAARPLFERALAIYKQALGPSHPETATNLNNLARLLQAQGDDAAARPLFERALAIYEQALRPDHPHTRTVRTNLAVLDRSQPPSKA